MVEIPRVTLNTDLNEGLCFGCGENNPSLLHGGILGCLLDEAMSNVAYATGNTCLTASITIRLKQPVKVEAPLVITAWITRQRKKLIETSGRVCLQDGTVIAESSAKQFIAENESGQPDKVREKKRHV
jgi:acyl-CoA thioesterase FadM